MAKEDGNIWKSGSGYGEGKRWWVSPERFWSWLGHRSGVSNGSEKTLRFVDCFFLFHLSDTLRFSRLFFQLWLLPALANCRNLQNRLHGRQLPCLGDCAALAPG